MLPPIRRRVLCALLLVGDGGISSDALLEAVWGEADATAHEGTLKSAVSFLRGALGHARVPRGRSGRYRLLLEPGDGLDLEEFRALVEQARPLMGADDQAAAALLHRAVDLWGRGAPLPDLPEESAQMRVLRDELLEERLEAQAALFQAQLGLGEHREVVREVRRALADAPLSEQLHGLLMRALYRSGQRAEALRHFEATDTRMIQETGAGVGTRLRDLRDELAADRPGSGSGDAVPVPGQLPPDVMDYTGRAEEITRLVEVLTPAPGDTGVRIAAIYGPGGIGKSALATHVAHHIRHHYPDGQLYAHLDATSGHARPVGDVLAEFLRSLGVRGEMPRTSRERTALFRSLLAGRRVLVLLDDAGSHEVHDLAPGTAGCAVIITSRAHLADGAMRHLRLDPLPAREATRLLGEIIGPGRVRAEPDEAATIAAACGGWPLAIRVAGSRLSSQPHWSLRYFAGLLGDSVRDADGTQVSTRIAAGSYEALDAGARHAFRVLSLAGPGDWAAWLVAMLTGDNDADQRVETLTTRSLITPAGADRLGQPRYRQHDLLRSYAADRLAENTAERDAAMCRLWDGWLALAARADSHIQHEPHHPPTPELAQGLDAPPCALKFVESGAREWFDQEITNVLAVIRLACREGHIRKAMWLALTASSYLFWSRRDWDTEYMWRLVMQSAAAGYPALAAEARLRLAVLISRLPGGAARAIPMLGTCVAFFADTGDQQGLARSLAARAFAAWVLTQDPDLPDRDGHLKQGAEDAQRGLRTARAARDIYSEMACVRSLGLVHAGLGDADTAITLVGDALACAERIAQETGQRADEAYTLRLLTIVQLAGRHFEDALALASRGWALMRMFGYRAGEGSFADLAGDALAGLGRYGEAADRYGEAADLYEGDTAPYLRVRCLNKRAAAAAAARSNLGG
ncbi:NB-ARC domain-containing protein [Planotetraspora sp. A-T 1434]|uniref:AfsR/SARP family transcriptional regulator n=1 Tax=Planotetraspora sp. A-T 1434 TaxID=2979219 RepID=UPI0021BE3FF4|nr:BTAD domain-containing putative transcriptional regulator [Planotetraspora sp. A-T 1434]MCT9930638.1 NB-ARC domain-containing protein [Planotetraspora sp. A-T 1434]